MPGFEDRAVCRAPAEEVWKLLYDPARFPEWWAGLDRVEGGEDSVTRYMSQWPDFAYPTRVATRQDEGRVVVSCLLSDILHEFALEPHPDGCAIVARTELPASETARLPALRDEMRRSLEGLVRRAEAG